MRKLAVLVLGLAAFVLNPAYGCSEDAPEFQYGADEMKSALAGTWTITFDGKPQRFRFAQKQAEVQQHSRAASLVSDAMACSSRTLVASASACADATHMPLMMIALDGYTGPATGELVIYSTVFDMGVLYVHVGERTVMAKIDPEGAILSSEVPMTHTR